jgi:hypothetical protein
MNSTRSFRNALGIKLQNENHQGQSKIIPSIIQLDDCQPRDPECMDHNSFCLHSFECSITDFDGTSELREPFVMSQLTVEECYILSE